MNVLDKVTRDFRKDFILPIQQGKVTLSPSSSSFDAFLKTIASSDEGEWTQAWFAGYAPAEHPEIVLVEFGGNDGLRGLPPDQTRRNLDTVLTGLQDAHIKILLAGITLPPNYGADYIHSFESIFRDLAARHHAAFVPMIYKNLVNVPNSIQADGIHPTAAGSDIIAAQ